MRWADPRPRIRSVKWRCVLQQRQVAFIPPQTKGRRWGKLRTQEVCGAGTEVRGGGDKGEEERKEMEQREGEGRRRRRGRRGRRRRGRRRKKRKRRKGLSKGTEQTD